MNKKLLFIYNPNSGKQMISKKLADIVDLYTKLGYDVTCHPTQARCDCMNTVAECCRLYDKLVISGGDGTLNEAVNGMMSVGFDGNFGYIPCGSTNDFSHSVGIPTKIMTAAETAMSGIPFRCDMGRLQERYFTYVAGFGTLTEVSYSTPQDVKNSLGFAAYILEGIAALPTITSFKISFESEERCGQGEYLLGLITNTVHVAGFKSLISDSVMLDDGLFEVLLVRKPKNAADLNKIIAAVLKKEYDNEFIDCFKTSKITIRSEAPLAWTLDGENGGEHTVSVIENFPRALGVMVAKPKTASDAGTNADTNTDSDLK